MKKLILLISMAVVAICFSSCAPQYVAVEPTYVEDVRPPRPSENHVWVEGDWVWRRQTHDYVRKGGYWDTPRRGRTYKPGHWTTNRRGHSWKMGEWE